MIPYHRISDLRNDLTSGTLTCSRLVEHYLNNIETHKGLNAFLEVWAEEASARAIEIDRKIAEGTAGRLAGVVLALKDNLCYKDHKVGASSKILEGFESQFTGTAVQRLLDEDAIIIGRTNCDEFAMGASNENSAYGPVKNAADPERVAGGSSGGSAVAVQADCCFAALGTDTGGSIRQPACFTGNYGFKSTYGLISRWGLLAYASSFDQVGPICRSIEDVILLTEIMAGKDDKDASMSQKTFEGFDRSRIQTMSEQKMTFAVMKDAIDHEGLDAEIKEKLLALINELEAQGHTVTYFNFPLLDKMVPAYYVLTTAEASSNYSRYAGVVYGYRSANAKDLESTFVNTRTEGFGAEVKRRIMLGTFVLSSDYYDAYYQKAQKVRRLIQDKTLEIFKNADAILMPTTSTPAFKIGEKSANPIAMYLADLFTVQANLAGVPAITLPAGTNTQNLPIGFQLMTSSFEEEKLFAASYIVKNALK